MPKSTSKVIFQDLGLIKYKESWEFQEQLFQKVIRQKTVNEKLPEEQRKPTDNYLLFCEHPHVYTLGKSGKQDNLLVNLQQLQAKGAEFFRTNRGGDVTYHGPGQIVGYPIINLEQFKLGIRNYIEKLETCIILTLAKYGLLGKRLPGATGVWLDAGVKGKERKICAIGVRASRWVTMHGFALNINTDLSYFGWINPCGFTDKKVTSLKQELGGEQDIINVKQELKKNFIAVFDAELSDVESISSTD